MSTAEPHVHSDTIISWAKGETIQKLCTIKDIWGDIEHPLWYEDGFYRVKPPSEVEMLKEQVRVLNNDILKLHKILGNTVPARKGLLVVSKYEPVCKSNLKDYLSRLEVAFEGTPWDL